MQRNTYRIYPAWSRGANATVISRRFLAEDTGLVHCQIGPLAVATQRMFDWLDKYL